MNGDDVQRSQLLSKIDVPLYMEQCCNITEVKQWSSFEVYLSRLSRIWFKFDKNLDSTSTY